MIDLSYDDQRRMECARSLDMTDVCRRLGIELTTRGKWRLCHCPSPAHDDRHPSCGINVQDNTFKCFSCGCGGDNIALTRLVRGCGFWEAVRWLIGDGTEPVRVYVPTAIKESNTPPPDLHLLQERVSRREYAKCLAPWALDFLRQRRIDLNLIDRYAIVSTDHPVATHRQKLVSANGREYRPTLPAPSLLFPYRDKDDLFVNLQARLHNPKPGARRFHFPVGSRTALWNPHDIVRLADGADFYICEGVTDALALMTSGRQALALASATGLNTDARTFIAQQSTRLHPHIYSDADLAGENLYRQLLAICPNLRRHPLPPGFKDFGAVWAAGCV